MRHEVELAKRRAYARRKRAEEDERQRRIRAWKEREERAPSASLRYGRVRDRYRGGWHLIEAAPGTEAAERKATLCSFTTAGGWGYVWAAGEARGALCGRCCGHASWRDESDRRHDAYLSLRHYGACSLGPRRWFWAVFAPIGEPGDPGRDQRYEEPTAEGYASDKAAALEAARAAGGELLTRAGRLAYLHRGRCEAARVSRGTDGSDAAPLEYVYEPYTSDLDSETHWAAYQIVKRTKTRVYVRRQRGDTECFVLDRATLERTGEARTGAARRWATYYARPSFGRDRSVPECLVALGLTPPCTRRQVERVYRRLARRDHPDHGGSHAAFVALQRSYEQALRLAEPAAATRRAS